MNNRTTTVKPGDIEHKWYVVDASGIPVGRLAAQVSLVLRGKNKPNFVYNADCGDFVIVINADKAVLTGGKADEVIYWHTGWPGRTEERCPRHDARGEARDAHREGRVGA